MLFLKEKETPVGSKIAPREDDSQSEQEESVLVCRVCGVEITSRGALFCMRADSVEQVFPNPAGLMRVILTARNARSLSISGQPTDAFTWFQGYTWRVASCASCASHLGWIFESTADSPHTFYGLLKDALREGS